MINLLLPIGLVVVVFALIQLVRSMREDDTEYCIEHTFQEAVENNGLVRLRLKDGRHISRCRVYSYDMKGRTAEVFVNPPKQVVVYRATPEHICVDQVRKARLRWFG